jgi:hypothetical protein
MEVSPALLSAAQEILRVGKQATGAHFPAALASADSIAIAGGVSATPRNLKTFDYCASKIINHDNLVALIFFLPQN